jgi:hypothetical protein
LHVLRPRHTTATTSTTRRRWILLAVPALAVLALTVALTGPATAAPVISINTHIPISGPAVDNPCTVGVVTLSGDLHLMGTVTDDASGGVHAIIHENAHLTGTDDQGNVYIGNDAQETIIDGRFDENGEIAQETDSQPLHVELIGHGTAPNFAEHVTAHVTLNANGTVTAVVVDVSLTCH